MTYLPGGRINATISGNTSGAGALVSTGTMTLAGGNNITLSQAGNAITISGANAAAAASQTLGMSNLGNTSGTSGVASGSALRYLFAGGNNITLSQSLNGASATLTVSAANQSVQTQNLYNLTLSGNTAGLMAQVSSGTLTLAGGNNVTLSQNGNAVTVSAANQSVQTQNMVNVSLSGNTAGAMAAITSGTLTLAGGNNVTLSQNANAVTISAASQSLQTSNVHNVTLSGNTAGVMAQVSSGTLTLAGGNNITLSQNGNAVSIIGGAGGGGGGIALANSQTTYTSGTANLAASGALTIASTTGQSFNFSVPQTSSLSATGAVSISTNGSTISIGAPVSPTFTTLSRFEYPEGLFTALQSQGQGSLSINHVYIPFYVTASAVKIGGSLSAATNTSATTASANVSLWMGIYTLNGSSLSLASSGSANNGFVWSQSASSTGNTSVNSMRQMTVPMNVNITPGEYWMAAVISSATTYTSFLYSIYGNSLLNPAATAAVLSPIGSATTAARDAMLFQGIYTAQTAAGPASIGNNQVNNTSVSNVMRANFYFAAFNATY